MTGSSAQSLRVSASTKQAKKQNGKASAPKRRAKAGAVAPPTSPTPEPGEWLSRKAAQALTSLSMRTLDRAIADQTLRACRVGRRIVIHRDDLRGFVERGDTTTKATSAMTNSRRTTTRAAHG